MASLENHIDRILGEARACLTAVEITLRLNAEFGSSDNPYQLGEIVACADKMTTLRKDGKKYCRKREDASQAAARIVRETTENHGHAVAMHYMPYNYCRVLAGWREHLPPFPHAKTALE